MKTRAPKAAATDRNTVSTQRSVTPATHTEAKPPTSGEIRFRDILVPCDFSEPAYHALQYAITFAKQFNGKITLVYVVEPLTVGTEAAMLVLNDDELVRQGKEKLAALRLQQGEDAQYICDIKVTVGKPFNEIATLARSLRQDAIIISTHGRTGLSHILLGSTAEKVVRHAPCPVLVVRNIES